MLLRAVSALSRRAAAKADHSTRSRMAQAVLANVFDKEAVAGREFLSYVWPAAGEA